jgi:predicted nicotinamide N-methyase
MMAPVRPYSGTLAVQEAPVLRSLIESRYQCCEEDLTVAGVQFSLLRVVDPNVLLEAVNPAAFLEDERLPYWSELWASSVALAEWCLTSSRLPGMRVLELGCGLGLAGIAAARAGAAVVMTDYEEDALLFARYNALRNVPGRMPQVLLFDWRRPRISGKFDLVLGADILYERSHFLPLLEAFAILLAPGGAVVLTDPDRSTGEPFAQRAEEWGYSVARDRGVMDHHGTRLSVTRFELCPSSVGAAGRGR